LSLVRRRSIFKWHFRSENTTNERTHEEDEEEGEEEEGEHMKSVRCTTRKAEKIVNQNAKSNENGDKKSNCNQTQRQDRRHLIARCANRQLNPIKSIDVRLNFD
jgi:hypothetical protein